jgi:hypothetical protein
MANQKVPVIAAILAQGPATVSDMCDETGYTDGQVRNTLDVMRKQGLAHIRGWTRMGAYGMAAIFQAGPGRDAARPFKQQAPTKPRAQRTSTFYEDPLAEHCKALATALVPRRKPEQQRAVNQLFVQWLARQAGISVV